jgi:monoamine oxidase
VVKTILVFQDPWWRRSGLSGTIVNPGGMFGAAVDASPEDGSGILIVFSSASGAQALGRLPDEKARVAAAMRWLSHSHGPGIPDPRAARSIDWSADPFSLGGYSSRRGIGGWLTAPDLFTPHGRLHFAGTETANRWRSFMDGAVQSGLRAADEIIGASLIPTRHGAE